MLDEFSTAGRRGYPVTSVPWAADVAVRVRKGLDNPTGDDDLGLSPGFAGEESRLLWRRAGIGGPGGAATTHGFCGFEGKVGQKCRPEFIMFFDLVVPLGGRSTQDFSCPGRDGPSARIDIALG